jgi:hypothetical protein
MTRRELALGGILLGVVVLWVLADREARVRWAAQVARLSEASRITDSLATALASERAQSARLLDSLSQPDSTGERLAREARQARQAARAALDSARATSDSLTAAVDALSATEAREDVALGVVAQRDGTIAELRAAGLRDSQLANDALGMMTKDRDRWRSLAESTTSPPMTKPSGWACVGGAGVVSGLGTGAGVGIMCGRRLR